MIKKFVEISWSLKLNATGGMNIERLSRYEIGEIDQTVL